MKKALFPIIMASVFFVPFVYAQKIPSYLYEPDFNSHEGFYVQLNGGTTIAHGSFLDVHISESGGMALMGGAGYAFWPWLMLQVDIPYYSLSGTRVTGVAPTIKFQLPIGDRFAVNAKFGALYPLILTNESGRKTFVPYVGGGFSFALSEHWTFSSELSGIPVPWTQLGAVLLGVTYYF